MRVIAISNLKKSTGTLKHSKRGRITIKYKYSGCDYTCYTIRELEGGVVGREEREGP